MKEATKHTPGWTPGPWHLDRDYEAVEGHIGITSADGPREHKGLAQVVVELEGDPYEEGIANSNLIASAPDLAEALEPFARAASGWFMKNYNDDEAVGSIGKTYTITAGDLFRARSALARARGETP